MNEMKYIYNKRRSPERETWSAEHAYSLMHNSVWYSIEIFFSEYEFSPCTDLYHNFGR